MNRIILLVIVDSRIIKYQQFRHNIRKLRRRKICQIGIELFYRLNNTSYAPPLKLN